MSKPAIRVAVTGAAGQIGYALLFRIASGEMLGKDQPVILQLLEIPDEKAQNALKGVMMELDDCAFPLLEGMSAHSDPKEAFKGAQIALLVGSRPRGPGMERADLLQINAKIFIEQGRLAEGTLRLVVPEAMQLADALLEEGLGLGRFGRDREMNLRHAGHQIGLLARTFVKNLAMVRMAWQRSGWDPPLPCCLLGGGLLSFCGLGFRQRSRRPFLCHRDTAHDENE